MIRLGVILFCSVSVNGKLSLSVVSRGMGIRKTYAGLVLSKHVSSNIFSDSFGHLSDIMHWNRDDEISVSLHPKDPAQVKLYVLFYTIHG